MGGIYVRTAGGLTPAASVPGPAARTPQQELWDLTVESLNRAARYTLGTYLPMVHPGTAPIVFAGTSEHHIRHPSSAALALAAGIDAGVYDPDITGVPLVDARAQAVRLVSSLAVAHRANGGTWGGPQNTPPPNTGGAGWQDAYWAYQAAAAGHLLWASLTGTQQAQVTAMVVWEANRMLTWTPPVWKNPAGVEQYAGDSKTEEIAWNAALLVLALVMQPAHANAATWRRKLALAAVTQHATPADLIAPGTVNGVVLSSLPGSNVSPDGTVVNHAIIHPDYMTSAGQSVFAALSLAGRGGVTIPGAVGRHADLIYGALSTLAFDPAVYAAPGGSIYPWPQTDALYYPQGNDWGTSRPVGAALMDVVAHRQGWDRGLSTTALDWAVLHMRRQVAMQHRSVSGRTYVSDTEDTYGSGEGAQAWPYGREMWVASCLGSAVLTLRYPAPTRTWANLSA